MLMIVLALIANPESLFRVTKSENGNEVIYSAVLGERCNLLGVSVDWRMADGHREPLLPIETPIYGIADRQALGPGATRVTVRGAPEHPFVVRFAETKDGCRAHAEVEIEGTRVRLGEVAIGPGLSIYLMGAALLDARKIRHRVR